MKHLKKLTIAFMIVSLCMLAGCENEEETEEGGLDLDDDTTLLLLVAAAQANSNAAANSSCRQNVTGCISTRYSCDASASCYSSLVACANSGDCPVGTALEIGTLSPNTAGGFVDPDAVAKQL